MAPYGLGSIFPASTHVLGQGVRCDSGPVGCLVHLRGKPGDLGRDVSVHGMDGSESGQYADGDLPAPTTPHVPRP
jgi:hypothetical protein